MVRSSLSAEGEHWRVLIGVGHEQIYVLKSVSLLWQACSRQRATRPNEETSYRDWVRERWQWPRVR